MTEATPQPPSSSSSSSFPLSLASMAADRSPLRHFFSASVHRQCARAGAEIAARLDGARRSVLRAAAEFPPFQAKPPLFAAISQRNAAAAEASGRHLFDLALSPESQQQSQIPWASMFPTRRCPLSPCSGFEVQLRQPILGKAARVVPITLDQVYLLKVEGIAFRFLPDPLQIKNALDLKSSDRSKGFDGVPVFQSELLVIKKKNKRYCPIYFQKEDIERELLRNSRVSKGSGLSQHIAVGSLEDVLKKMEINEKNSGWEDLIFIPPGKSLSEHIKEVAA